MVKAVIATILLVIGGTLMPAFPINLVPLVVGGWMIGTIAAEADYR